MPRLEIKSNGKKESIPFEKEEISIGRQAGNDIVLEDVKASRRHCVIRHSKGTFRLKDLKSQNGTWIGGNRVDEAIIALGDTLRIGTTFIRLLPDEVDDEDAKDLPTARIVIEGDGELPPSPTDRTNVATTLAARAVGVGPLSKQLAPLMLACVNVPMPPGSPQVISDVQLLNRKSQPIVLDKQGKAR